ncbi:alcohol dehydrogenase catalytic domain-containing protein [Actinomadura sp. KC345]|uniref:alcohol dehydrogenase catalytic domain-containing protein n=1 Tax=Actinomadura sp. KC345 TaxID=2530371 RepID=UPI002442C673|nr:alcohol dehydrogenase catalytic domain-containing protein [Actinomadura sp. KC345]
MRTTAGWQADGSTLRRTLLNRRDLRPDDLAVRIDYCGVCHTDLHALNGDAARPLVPGHEFTGVVGRDRGRGHPLLRR